MKQNPNLYRALYRWYDQYHRVLPWRDTTDPYCIWLSEIILQQTRVAQGMDYYLRFVGRFPDVRSLADADEDEVLRYWQGLGYYSRARNLHKAAKLIVERNWLPFPAIWEQLRQLPGVGDYTAGAIASFAYDLPYPAMDGNVYRVVARLFDCDLPFDTSAGKRHFHTLIDSLLDRDHPRLFNSAIMEFGALYCTPTLTDGEGGSACPRCPLALYCQAHAHHTAELLPVRKPRPTLRDRYLNYFILLAPTQDAQKTAETSSSDGVAALFAPFSDAMPTLFDAPQNTSFGAESTALSTLLHRREGKDIWHHLYEFPLLESDHLLGTEEATSLLGTADWHSLDLRHILSHQRLHARFFLCRVDHLPDASDLFADAFPVPLSRLDDYALSRLTLRALHR